MNPINTGGFQVQSQPGINYPNPQLYSGGLANIIPGAQQGLSAVAQFQQIAQNANEAPINRQLAQIKLSQAQQALANQPVQDRIAQLKLQQLLQPQSTLIGTDIVRTPVNIGDNVEVPAGTKIPTGFDVTKQGIYRVFDPATQTYTTEKRIIEPIMTAEQASRNEDLAAARAENARLRAAELERKKIVDASMEAKRAAEIDKIKAGLADKSLRKLDQGTDPETGKMVTRIYDTRSGTIIAIPSEMLPIDNSTFKLDLGGVTVPTVNKATPAPSTAPVDQPATESEINDILSGASSSASSKAFTTEAEAEAAARAGTLRKGEKITIGGVVGTWQ